MQALERALALIAALILVDRIASEKNIAAPAGDATGTPSENDGGIELTTPVIDKLLLQDVFPYLPAV
jgi:hypothetical protein